MLHPLTPSEPGRGYKHPSPFSNASQLDLRQERETGCRCIFLLKGIISLIASSNKGETMPTFPSQSNIWWVNLTRQRRGWEVTPHTEQRELQKGKQRTEHNGTKEKKISFFKRRTKKTSWEASVRQVQWTKSVQNSGNKQHSASWAGSLTHLKIGRHDIHKTSVKKGNIQDKSTPWSICNRQKI